MPKKLDLEALKNEFVNKTFNLLIVIDVYKDSISNRYFFKCMCDCGNEVNIQYNKVISGHTKSCGCYRKSKEFSSKLKSVWRNNPIKLKNKTDKFIKWCKDNPDKVKEKTANRSNTYRNNPSILKNQVSKRKTTLKNNPSIQININNKIHEAWSEDKRSSFSEYKTNYFRFHPEVTSSISKSLIKYYNDNPNRLANISANNKQWCVDNRDFIKSLGILHSSYMKASRINIINDSNSDIDSFIEILNPSQRDLFFSGSIKADSIISVMCSVCGEYEDRVFNNVWRLSDCKFKNHVSPICAKCRHQLASSHYEDDITDFISTIYNSEIIRNSHDIISPFELDLYYPEKKIAIEFNGDYWHSCKFKDNMYHYNKFKMCKEIGITLVSIFECDWLSMCDDIKDYLRDLFEYRENKLSFIDDHKMNNNYSSPICASYNYNELVYHCKNNTIYTCGFSCL